METCTRKGSVGSSLAWPHESRTTPHGLEAPVAVDPKEDCEHRWGFTGNSMDGDHGRGAQMTCTKCSKTEWKYSKGPGLGLMMRRAYNAFINNGEYVAVPPDEREKWCEAVKAVIETPQLIVTLQKGDTIHAYPDGVIAAVAKKKATTA